MLKAGDQAPSFELPDQHGQPWNLQEHLCRGSLILYFYPADFTPGCTREACNVRDMHDDLVSSGLKIAGISPQDSASHLSFAEQHELNFTLLADPDKQVIKAYEVDGPLGFGVRRASYLVGDDGVIKDAIMADLLIDRHTRFFRRAMEMQKA